MNREEAFQAMRDGNKVTHRNFSEDEYYEMKRGVIYAEDGVNHTSTFWSTDDNNWREDGWTVYDE